MNFTTYYQLKKPLGMEKYSIEVHNANSDILDSELKRLDQKTEKLGELTALQNDLTDHKENDAFHITPAERESWNHTAGHVSDTARHITTEERAHWNTAASHAASDHARADATKTEASEINGSIKINGMETAVYTHPSGSNPHGTTKEDLGLGEVENKNSSAIRGELTKDNVTNALGYIPYTPNEIDSKISELGANTDLSNYALKEDLSNYALKSIFSVGSINNEVNHKCGDRSVSFGRFCYASGRSCQSFGSQNTNNGGESFIAGSYNEIDTKSLDTAILGNSCMASNTLNCFLTGRDNEISCTGTTYGSAIFGADNNINGGTNVFDSFIFGSNNTMMSDNVIRNSVILGNNNTAKSNQIVAGHYNKSTTAASGSGNSGDAFIIGNGTDSSASNAFRVTYKGEVFGKAAYSATGADYAEFFEWKDGNPNNEDRRGYFVTMDGDKIKKASSNDYILGIVSANPCVLGNADMEWHEKYLKDDFGAYIIEPQKIIYNVSTGERDEHEKLIYVQGEKDISFYKENPNYDPSQTYIPRNERKEWDAIGMLGVLAVYDDGTCKVNGYCSCNNDGIATSSTTGYRVIARIKENIIKIILK